jgi:hypothetical protein
MNDNQTVNEARLRDLSPLEGMKTANLSSLARKVTLSNLAANRDLLRAGDTDRRTIWLVSGRLELREGDRTIAILRGGTPETRTPLSPILSRKFTARAIDPIQYLAIDSDLPDTLITWDQTGIYEVGELATQFGPQSRFYSKPQHVCRGLMGAKSDEEEDLPRISALSRHTTVCTLPPLQTLRSISKQ